MKKNNESDKIVCPSAKGKTGSSLLGVRQNGVISILPKPLQIDDRFIEEANQGAPAEQNFRFVNKCVEAGCKQWTGKRCGVIDKMVGFLDKVEAKEELPPCSIRQQCRWHIQVGASACKICPYVITEISQEEIDAYFIDYLSKPNHI